jgi:hypothetical protein
MAGLNFTDVTYKTSIYKDKAIPGQALRVPGG